MINEIITGISLKLNEYFGDGYRIYKNDVKQGLKEPCFFIAVIAPSRTDQLGERWRMDIPFDVQYIPKAEGDNAELYDVEGTLMDILSHITLPDGSSYRGRNISCEIVDSVLHVFVTYTAWLKHIADEVKMNKLDQDIGIKEE